MFDKWIEFFRKPEEMTAPGEPVAGVNNHGSMFFHHINKIEVDYRKRGHKRCGLAEITIKDAKGYEFDIYFFGDGTDHIELETHDHNEK